jgi:hypothetical protein
MKKIVLVVLVLIITQSVIAIEKLDESKPCEKDITQSVIAIEEWDESKPYEKDNIVAHRDLTYKALWWTMGDIPSKGKPWEEVTPPSPYPVIDTELTYYIPKNETSLSGDLTSKISGGEAPYVVIISQEPSNGTVNFSEGTFTYTPNKRLDDADEFTDSFMIKVQDTGKKESDLATVNIKLDKWLPEKYYESGIESDIRSMSVPCETNCWYEFWKNQIPLVNQKEVEAIKYYVRVKGSDKQDLSKISETVSPDNPDNVNRVIRLMPKEKFEAIFPRTKQMTPINPDDKFIPGKIFSYKNFLKAIAVMPGYCGDYKDHPSAYIQEELKKDPKFADTMAKKFLATTLAHAVQETSSSGNSTTGDWQHTNSGFLSKLNGTFENVKETGSALPDYHDNQGPFCKTPEGPLYYLTAGNKYYGRGAKQLSYPVNYANTSLLLYGDLRLVRYPNLVEKDILPYLTAITYTLIPKSGNPSIAEVMDGSWSHKLNASGAVEDFIAIYDRPFPLTVLIVNGGPECNGHKEDWSVANSKTRIDGYNYFSTADVLLDPKITYEVETGDNYYKVDKLKTETINQAKAEHNYQPLFKRYYYYKFDDSEKKPVKDWDTGVQIFGGKAVHDNIKK